MSKTEEKINKLKSAFQGKKRMELLITIVIVAIIAGLFLAGDGSGDKSTQKTESESLTDYVARTEKRLKEVLSTINGAGQVEVMITYETGPEIVPATDTTRQSNSTGSSQEGSNTSENETVKAATIQQQSGTEPIVLTEKQPKVRGVIVVAQGAEDIRVKIELQQAVKTVLDVSLAQIDVFTRKNEK